MSESPRSHLPELTPTLFRKDWTARNLDAQIADIDPQVCIDEYHLLSQHSPRRGAAGRSYFGERDGRPNASNKSNRREEHLAIALFNMQRHWPSADGGWGRWLDYQTPLKARRADAGIGKIDLLGERRTGVC